MIKKKLFCDAIRRLQVASDGQEKYRQINKELNAQLCGEIGEYNFPVVHEDLVIQLLEDAADDQFGDIVWFIYDMDYGRRLNQTATMTDLDGNVHNVRTIEDLYDYLDAMHSYRVHTKMKELKEKHKKENNTNEDNA